MLRGYVCVCVFIRYDNGSCMRMSCVCVVLHYVVSVLRCYENNPIVEEGHFDLLPLTCQRPMKHF